MARLLCSLFRFHNAIFIWERLDMQSCGIDVARTEGTDQEL